MVTRLYKVYKASDYDSIDLSKVASNIRWNVDGTEFIVEFKEKPHGNTVVMTRDEAVILMNTDAWTDATQFDDLQFR